MTSGNAWRQVATFLTLSVALCLPSYYFVMFAESIDAISDVAVAGIMWAPGVAAIITRLFYQKNVRGFGWGLGSPRYIVFSYFLPLAAGLIVYGTVWATNLGGFSAARLAPGGESWSGPEALVFWRRVGEAAAGGFIVEAILALGEELGWRGLLVPELTKLVPFWAVGLLSGSIWILFHVPGILFAGYHSRAPVWYGLAAIKCYLSSMQLVVRV